MRALIRLIVVAGASFSASTPSRSGRLRPRSGAAATQAISLTGVRVDLLSIANAERGNIALNSQCAPR